MINKSADLDEASTIAKVIARYTVSMTNKFKMGTAHDRTILSAAISILTQAMVAASQNNFAEAQMLYGAAIKLAALTGKKE